MINRFQRNYFKALFLILIFASTFHTALAQKPAYLLYRDNGKRVSYDKMLKEAGQADVVLFGEQHTNPISHWLQLELTTDLYREKRDGLILGAEMFEADNQLILNEYLAGFITETKFEEEARLWNNYATDYKPLIQLAKDHGLTFVASNIPRRYANMVFKRGVGSLDSLSSTAQSYMAPLPLEYDKSLECYAQLMGSGAPSMGNPAPAGDTLNPMAGHGSVNLADAQAIKDAAMSYFILKYWQPGKLLIHYNGAYHSDNYESINWFLKRDRPNLKIVTISTVSQDDLEQLDKESEGLADFIIVVPSNMTLTHR